MITMHVIYIRGKRGTLRPRKFKEGDYDGGVQRPPNHKHKTKIGKPHHTHFQGVGKAHEAAKAKKTK